MNDPDQRGETPKPADPSDSWDLVWSVFEQAAELPAEEQNAFLDRACEGDESVRRAVIEMLEADRRQEGAFLDRPVLDPPASEPTEPMDPGGADAPPQERLGPYRLRQKIGEGGMSSVYLAVRDDDAYQRRVVVKVIRPGMETEHVVQRLRAERQILAGLDHPNVARLYDGGTTERGLPYFVMEYVDGLPVDVYCERGELSVRERLELFQKICAAVSYAHRNLVVHRDIKPSNILVTADGEPKLLDFGIAKLLNPDLGAPEIEPTVTASRMLTPSYASPEQIRGKMITTASDVYSLGVLLYKILTRTLPYDFRRRSAAEIEQLVTESEPPPPSRVAEEPSTGGKVDARRNAELRRRLAGDLDAIVLKTLRAAPQKRYAGVDQLTEDVGRYLDGLPVEARRGNRAYRIGKFVRRRRAPLAVTAAVALIVLYFVAALARQSARLEVERDQARAARDEKQHVIALFEDIVDYAEPYVTPGEELTVRQAVERSLPVMEARLVDQPAVRAQLLHTTGSMLDRLGAHEGAQEQLQEALELRRTLGTDPRELAETLIASASVHTNLGDYDRALELAREAVELSASMDPNDDGAYRGAAGAFYADGGSSLRVAALNQLVSALCSLEEFHQAQEPALEALERSQDLVGAARRHRMWALELSATVQNKVGNYEESISLRRRSLALRRELLGEKHPSQMPSLSNLGLALRWAGELDAAVRTYEEVLGLVGETYGEDDYRYAFTLNNLAGVRFVRGDYEGALADYERTGEIFRASMGEDHWRNFFFAVNAEAARVRVGNAEPAERRLRSELGRWRPKLGDDHWLVVHAESVLGEAIAAQGRHEEGGELLETSYRRLIELEAKDRYQRQALDRLSRFLDERGRAGEIPAFTALLPSAEETRTDPG